MHDKAPAKPCPGSPRSEEARALWQPEEYDPKYAKWNMADLPFSFIPWKKKVTADKKARYGIVADLLKRALINDNSAKAILRELSSMEDNKKYEGLGMSAEARGVADMLYGFNMTRRTFLRPLPRRLRP